MGSVGLVPFQARHVNASRILRSSHNSSSPFSKMEEVDHEILGQNTRRLI